MTFETTKAAQLSVVPSKKTTPTTCSSSVPLLTPEDEDHDHHREAMGKFAKRFYTDKKMVIITGAGISVSAGIPDFRSAGGLYEQVGKKYQEDLLRALERTNHGKNDEAKKISDNNAMTSKDPKEPKESSSRLPKPRGKDFFDASFYQNESTRPLFLRFITELKGLCDQARPTPTHRQFAQMVREGRVMRWYTQNIDGLEEQCEGLTTTLAALKEEGGGSGDGDSQSSTTTTLSSSWSRRVSVVGLHGSLARLVCTVCRGIQAYSDALHGATLAKGHGPECPRCQSIAERRAARGQRQVRAGQLRPDIVLYNEAHPHGDQIAELLTADLARRPRVLLVVGTSLRVVGLGRMIKDLARTIHASSPDGLVVYMNKTPLTGTSEWRGVFDLQLVGECDRWMEVMGSCMKRIMSSTQSIKLPMPITTVAVAVEGKKDETATTTNNDNNSIGERQSIGGEEKENKPKAKATTTSIQARMDSFVKTRKSAAAAVNTAKKVVEVTKEDDNEYHPKPRLVRSLKS